MKTFIKQVIIFINLHKNYGKLAKQKSYYIYIYTFPFFGFILSLILRLLIRINKKNLSKIASHKLFLSTLRFLSPKDRQTIADILPKYNSKITPLNKNNFILKKNVQEILDQIHLEGVSYLGKVFNKKQCEDFKNLLLNQDCFNSQTAIQSNGKPIIFNPKSEPFINKKNAYYCFERSITLSFKPLYDFLENDKLRSVINNYLSFQASIYNCSTWYNPPTHQEHYVHRSHRDYDDFKFLGIVIYWNNIDQKNGPLTYVKRSHRNSAILEPHTKLIGEAGSVFLVDTFGLHSGLPVIDGSRYTTSLRFGQKFNAAAVNDGFN
jgi:hypothetical protein